MKITGLAFSEKSPVKLMENGTFSDVSALFEGGLFSHYKQVMIWINYYLKIRKIYFILTMCFGLIDKYDIFSAENISCIYNSGIKFALWVRVRVILVIKRPTSDQHSCVAYAQGKFEFEIIKFVIIYLP